MRLPTKCHSTWQTAMHTIDDLYVERSMNNLNGLKHLAQIII